MVLLDLGEHRLKDVADAVSIFQLGEGSFPPLKTISNTNLPRPASSFVGRETEVAEVLSRIEGGTRLLTLTGPGGSGKTRLAIEAAATLVPSYKAEVFWVGPASLRNPALVTETIAQTLGAKDGLAEHVGEREMLLLLDNLEQYERFAGSLGLAVESYEAAGPANYAAAVVEQDNFRAAIERARIEHRELAVRLAVALEQFWVAHSPSEGERTFEALLAEEPTLRPDVHARALRLP